MDLDDAKRQAAEDLHRKLRSARSEAGVTLEVVAQRIRELGHPELTLTTGKTVAAWFNQTPRVPFYAIDAVAQALGVPLSRFSWYPEPQQASEGPRPAAGAEAAVVAVLAAQGRALLEIQANVEALALAVQSLSPGRAGQAGKARTSH